LSNWLFHFESVGLVLVCLFCDGDRFGYTPIAKQLPVDSHSLFASPATTSSSTQDWMRRLELFDWTSFFALYQCWRDRETWKDAQLKDTEFVEARHLLFTTRESYRRSGITMEKLLQEQHGQLSKHLHVVHLIAKFKTHFEKVCDFFLLSVCL
jgi:hypothetical protein